MTWIVDHGWRRSGCQSVSVRCFSDQASSQSPCGSHAWGIQPQCPRAGSPGKPSAFNLPFQWNHWSFFFRFTSHAEMSDVTTKRTAIG